MNATMLFVCLTASATLAQPETKVKTPPIEVKTETRDGKTHSFLLYNRVYIGRQYHKSKDEPDLPRLPTTYFHDKSPIGIILKDPRAFPPKDAPPVAVLGMDIGTLAAYAQPGQVFHFTERVPAFVKLSLPDKGQERQFTFIQDAMDRGGKVKVFEGEPRAMLEKHGPRGFYKVIVINTYKTPVVEVHNELLTKEAIAMLMSKLTDDGIVCYHTSNRYYQMAPIIASAANELKLACIVGKDPGYYDDPKSDFRFASEWVMVARHEKHLAHLKNDKESKVTWQAPTVSSIRRIKDMERKVDREFLWSDKGEQSFRGLYYSDPKIDSLYDTLNDVSEFFRGTLGIPFKHVDTVDRPLRGVIRAWSASSAERLNSAPPPKEKTSEKK